MSPATRHHILIALSILLLVVGGMIYLLCRSETILLNRLVQAIGLGPCFEVPRAYMHERFPYAVWVYSLPAGLWAASYILMAHTFSEGMTARSRLAYAAVIPLLGALSELLQWCDIVPGAFDLLDILCYITPYLLYLIIFKYF